MHVRRGVDGLHGGDHAQSPESLDIIRMYDLGVFDSRAMGAAHLLVCALNRVEHVANRAVPDRVGGHLQAVRVGAADDVSQSISLHHSDAHIVAALVRLEHGGGLRPQRPVRKGLDRARSQKRISLSRPPSFCDCAIQRSRRYHHPEPQREIPRGA